MANPLFSLFIPIALRIIPTIQSGHRTIKPTMEETKPAMAKPFLLLTPSLTASG